MREKVAWARKNIIIILIVLGVAAVGYYKYSSSSAVITYEYATATVKNLQKTVEGSGTVASLSELNIQQLQNGGKVTAVYVKPGDYVNSGQIIAQLDNRQASIQLAQARASYNKVVNGATKETLDISKQSVANAQTSYDLAKQSQELAVANAKKNLLNSSIAAVAQMDLCLLLVS
jgi:HlyD family secretion protein